MNRYTALVRRLHFASPLAHTAGSKLSLPPAQAHHARDVLRLVIGDAIELFDDIGCSADSVIQSCDERHVIVSVRSVQPPSDRAIAFGVAAAVPKGARADWMVEKLSELGTSFFIPLVTTRSVVVPDGKNKIQRWQRLACEAARQSRAPAVMRIDPLITLPELLKRMNHDNQIGLCFSTQSTAQPMFHAIDQLRHTRKVMNLFIGPEGGWTDDEMARMRAAGLTETALTTTILRVESAAVAAAAVLATAFASGNLIDHPSS